MMSSLTYLALSSLLKLVHDWNEFQQVNKGICASNACDNAKLGLKYVKFKTHDSYNIQIQQNYHRNLNRELGSM